MLQRDDLDIVFTRQVDTANNADHARHVAGAVRGDDRGRLDAVALVAGEGVRTLIIVVSSDSAANIFADLHDRLAALGHLANEKLEDVPHVRPNLQFNVHT